MGKIALLAVLVLAGCQSLGGGTFCDIARPIRLGPTTVDAMTDPEVDAVLAHNKKGQELCGWNPT